MRSLSCLLPFVAAPFLLSALSGCASDVSDQTDQPEEASGTDESAEAAAATAANGQGLAADYFTGVNFTKKVLSRTDKYVAFDWNDEAPAAAVPRTNFSVRWTGYVVPEYSEKYTFTARTDDGARLWVNGQLLVNDWTSHALKDDSATITLEAGKSYAIKLEYFQATGGATAALLWSSAHVAQTVVPNRDLFVAPKAPLSTCPASAVNGGPNLWANLEACGWAGAKNTGVTSTAVLETQGTEIITADNTVFANAIVNGCIIVKAHDVKIQNVRVNFTPGTDCSSNAGGAAINVGDGATASITDTEVDGNGQVHIGIRNGGQGLNLLRVNVHDVEDGVYANLPAADRLAYPTAGSNTIITDSYFHSFVPRQFNNKTMLDAKRSNGHIDGVQTDGGAVNTQLIHNTFDMGFGTYTARYSDGSTTAPEGQSNGFIDSATALWNGDNHDLKDILVSKNLFAAKGGFVHYVYDRTGLVDGVCGASSTGAPNSCGSVLDVRFTDNRYSTLYNECIGGYGVWFNNGDPTGGWGANGNLRTSNKVVENGQSVDADATPTKASGTHCQ